GEPAAQTEKGDGVRRYLPAGLLVLGVIAGSGIRSTPAGAVAAAALRSVTQVKVGPSLTGGGTGPAVSIDIGPGVIKNGRVQDGTLQIQKFAPAARLALKGDPGAPGADGPAGPTWPQG